MRRELNSLPLIVRCFREPISQPIRKGGRLDIPVRYLEAGFSIFAEI
jgi:hypothetical protein